MHTADAESKTFPFGQAIVWHPSEEILESSNLKAFMNRHEIETLEELQQRSVTNIEWFWESVLEDLGIQFHRPYDRILDTTRGIPFARWCVGGGMNIVENCLDRWRGTEVWDSVAIKYESEEGGKRSLKYQDLHTEVSRCASALRMAGIGKGDVVALFMPMTPEIVIAFLATARIGAIILPLFSGYGPSAIVSRITDAGAKVMFTADAFARRGKTVPMKPVADEALRRCESIQHVVVRRQSGPDSSMTAGRDVEWDAFIDRSADLAFTEQTEAEDPVMLIYTSGTTGRSKGAVHTHCGFPIKAAQDMRQCMDVKRGETMYWMTDMGWMMGPWEVFGTLLNGASMVLYDGAPDYPAPDRTWQIASEHGVTHLGLSPSFIRAVRPFGADPVKRHDLSRLRAVCSTGSPWDPESWMWLFESVLNREKPILNYSGGTEISGGIVCGNFLRPLKPCAFSGRVPGMDADVVDENGSPVRRRVGELVIRKPWIGMTRSFWNDDERYLETYWNRFEGMWLHGDFAAIDEDGLWYIMGRSDDTIKVAGKRLGPAEVESILNAHPSVAESAAIGVPDEIKGEEVVAFCVLKPGEEANEKLRRALEDRLVKELGKPLRPREIRFTSALPKTRNAKVMHRIIRAAYLGRDAGDVSSIEDPASIDAIKGAV